MLLQQAPDSHEATQLPPGAPPVPPCCPQLRAALLRAAQHEACHSGTQAPGYVRKVSLFPHSPPLLQQFLQREGWEMQTQVPGERVWVLRTSPAQERGWWLGRRDTFTSPCGDRDHAAFPETPGVWVLSPRPLLGFQEGKIALGRAELPREAQRSLLCIASSNQVHVQARLFPRLYLCNPITL